jgi:myosin heavy subunit
MTAAEGFAGLLARLRGRPPIEEDERLLELFRNRAALKKELHALDEEHHQLRDRLKLQEGQTQRVEDQLEKLCQFLGRPEHGPRSLAYFQLRELWRAGAQRLRRFAEELATQQQDRERRQQLADFESRRQGRLAELERELLEARALADQLLAEQKLTQQRLATLRGFWNVLGRRALRRETEARQQRIASAQTEVTRLEAAREALHAERPPAFEGLGRDGRRAVNLAVLACADYGDDRACEKLMGQVARALREMEHGRNDLAEIKLRTERMRRSAKYRRETDTIPVAESLGGEAPARLGENSGVLRDEFWDLPKVLLA